MMTGRPGFRYRLILAGAVAVGVAAFHSSAEAAFLRWGAPHVKTNTTAKCFSFAQSTLQTLSFTSIQKTPSEVTGHKGGAYVAITCIATAPQVTAVVMVVDNSDTEAVQTRAAVVDTISKFVGID
jgi:hypothetical protein